MGTRNLVIVYYKGRYRIAQYGQYDGGPSHQGRDVLEFARDPELLAKLAAALDANMVYEPSKQELDEIDKKVGELKKRFEEEWRREHEKKFGPPEQYIAGLETTHPALFKIYDEFGVWLQEHPDIGHDELANKLGRVLVAAISEMATRLPMSVFERPEDANKLAPESKAYSIVCPSLWRNTGAQILKIVADATEKIPMVDSLNFITTGALCEWSWVLDLDARTLECWHGTNGSRESTRFDHLEGFRSGTGKRPVLIDSFPLDNLPDEPTFLKECEVEEVVVFMKKRQEGERAQGKEEGKEDEENPQEEGEKGVKEFFTLTFATVQR